MRSALLIIVLFGCAQAELETDAEVDAFSSVATSGFDGSGPDLRPLDAAAGRPVDAAPAPDMNRPPPPPRRDAAPPRRDAAPPRGDAAPPPPVADMALPDAAVCDDPELCNGIDDDCDGTIDEMAGCPCLHITREATAYLLCDMDREWPDARAACEAVGYALAVVDDAAEDAFIFQQVSQRGFDDVWLGLNDRQQEGSWVWLDGLPLAYANWDDGEPNDGGGEDCGLLMTEPARRASRWDDRPCGRDQPYVCEAPVAGP